MNAIKPTVLTTEDGVEREVRFTMGARKRMAEAFEGLSLQDIFNRHGDGALPKLLHCCLYDRAGNPPADLTADSLAELLPGNAGVELMALLLSAVTQGEVPKNEFEARMRKAMEENLIGFISGASAPSASDSPPQNSGMESPSPNSAPEPSDTANNSGSPTTAPDLSPPPSTT